MMTAQMHPMARMACALVACLCLSGPVSFAAGLKDVSAGVYDLEKSHASLTWRVRHKGLSWYTVRFTDFDATLRFDPAKPADSQLRVSIDPMSVRTDHPTKAKAWETELGEDPKWFNAKAFPAITFVSTAIRKKGRNKGIITGDVTFLGVTRSVSLKTVFNGVANFPWYGERDVIGFSAKGTLKRSDFGMTALLPDIGDDVQIIVEAEFLERSKPDTNR